MSNLNDTAENRHCNSSPPGEANPPDVLKELSNVIRETMREELAAHRQQEKVPELFERPAAAEALRISQRKLSTLTAAGEVACIRIGRRVLYSAAALRAYIRRQAEGGRS